jgi:hypothetical protein
MHECIHLRMAKNQHNIQFGFGSLDMGIVLILGSFR